MPKVDNAIIMAAGTASRFAPLSYERHKALTVVRGEVLIERQIRQLREAGIERIYVVTGYRSEQFQYLKDGFGVELIHNPDYLTRNNNGSIYAAKDVIRNTYICSADNYFAGNPFTDTVDGSYYAVVYRSGPTEEWCVTEKAGMIDSVTIGGADAWIMLGHVFWDADFSGRFLGILSREYERPEVAGMLWEEIYLRHIHELPMRARKYPDRFIYEFDTLDELRAFDPSYVNDTRSAILRKIAEELQIPESALKKITAYKGDNAEAAGFTFIAGGKNFRYRYGTGRIEEVKHGK